MVGTITPFILKTDDNPEGTDRATLENARKGFTNDLPKLLADYAPTFFGTSKNHVSQKSWTGG